MKNKILWVLLLLVSVRVQAATFEIQHLEPLNWWVGMKNPELQLLVHGPNISALTPDAAYPGVQLVSVERTDNANYLFINLRIEPAAKPGSLKLQFKQADKTLLVRDFKLLPRSPASRLRKGFSPADAIYLVVPDRFANGDPKNDAMPGLQETLNRDFSGGRHGGDIKGLAKNLDYIASMGFTMIWPTPFTENNQEAYSYHGYSVTDHYKIDARFGTNGEYKAMVAKANKKGLGIIQDIVLNHIGSGHWWMRDMPEKNWINFPDQYTETTHRRTTLHDIHAADDDREVFASGWFVKTMPDLNQRNPRLAKYLIQNTIWWIEYANLSGVREDTYSYADKAFLAHWGKAVMDEYPNFNIVGEEWTVNAAIVSSWQRGKRNDNGYVSYLPSLMDFPVHYALRDGLTEEEGQDKGLVKIYEAIANDFLYADPMNLVLFPDNHDTSRIFPALDNNLDLYKNAIVFFATTRGIPQFFYGSEVLKTSPKQRDDGAVRSDMPGGWKGDSINAFTGVGLSAPMREAQDFVRKVLQWRKSNSSIHLGSLLHYVPQKNTYVYFRTHDAKTVMVVLNKNSQDSSLDLARFTQGLRQAKRGKNILTGESMDLTKPIPLRPMTPMIIELN
jgi:neopullulanase